MIILLKEKYYPSGSLTLNVTHNWRCCLKELANHNNV